MQCGLTHGLHNERVIAETRGSETKESKEEEIKEEEKGREREKDKSALLAPWISASAAWAPDMSVTEPSMSFVSCGLVRCSSSKPGVSMLAG